MRKKPGADLSVIALNIVFRYMPAPGEPTSRNPGRTSSFSAPSSRTANETDPLVVRHRNGYTGEPPQSRLEMLKNSQFRDVRARIFAKYSSSQWVEIGAVDVQRQLLVR